MNEEAFVAAVYKALKIEYNTELQWHALPGIRHFEEAGGSIDDAVRELGPMIDIRRIEPEFKKYDRRPSL